MTFDLAQMIADREAGTPGDKWVRMTTPARNPDWVNADTRRENRVPAMEAEIIRLTARVERLTTGLEFYADKANWCARIAVNGPGDVDLQDPVMSGDDHGNLARAALSTPTEEPKA